MGKKCAVCGEEVASDAIECPKCGGGVFESEKRHSDSVDSVSSAPSLGDSHSGKRRQSPSFWKKVFGRNKQALHDQPREAPQPIQSVKAKEALAIVVPRHETEYKDCAPVLSLLRSLMASPKMARAHRRGVDIFFGGYDDDTRPIWQIPDIRQYVRMLNDQFPYWLFFMSDILPNFAGLVRCLMPLDTTEEGRRKFIKEQLLPRWLAAMHEISQYADMTENEVKEILERSMRYLIKEVVIKA